MRSRWFAATAAAAIVCLASAGSLVSVAQADGSDKTGHPAKLTERQRLARIALPAGLQMAQKHAKRPTVTWHGQQVRSANPYLANIPRPASVDYAWWNRYLDRKSTQRTGQHKVDPLLYDEQEPNGTNGSNDVQSNAEEITQFGSGVGKTPAVRIEGELSPPNVEPDDLTTAEDQGAIPLATETDIPGSTDAVLVHSRIGNGPHGSAGDATGDFDFFHVAADAGQIIHASTEGSDFDTIVLVYDADGNILGASDDANGTLQSDLLFEAPADGDYYVLVTGFLSLPEDPFDSGSGLGNGAEGLYDLLLTVGLTDVDYYAVNLAAGDVLAGTMRGNSADMVVHKFDGSKRIGTLQDASFIYPIETPLPGGGNSDFAYVAEEAGLYAVSTLIGAGDYRMQLEVYRPGSESGGQKIRQTIFLDFDGQRVNTAVFGGVGVAQLSPLSAFMGRWGLPSSDLNAVIDQIVATVNENVRADLKAQGLNDDFKIRITNSRDNPDAFGTPKTSRVIIGGTIDQSGVFTIGVAQSIDPGNYGRQETALVLLDILSGDNTDDASLNFYLNGSSDKVKFIGTAVGNVTSHEIGHFIGSFHVDQFNDVLNLMDQGGNFPLLYGVGDDGIGGTADDPDVDFGIDTYNPNEGFSGFEDTLNNSAWASAG